VRFTFEGALPVRSPYRLDLTVYALRRLAGNVVDLFDERGIYRRALHAGRGINVVEVRQTGARSLHVRIAGPQPRAQLAIVERMLGTCSDMREWEKRVAPFPWLKELAREVRGLRPPRYPTLWEASANAIVFQQISIHAAAAIMRRLIEALSPPVALDGLRSHPFFTEAQLLAAKERPLANAGLSANKIAHLRSAAETFFGTRIESELRELSSDDAAGRLRAIRGIGPWSAALILLRGLGRLDVFPLRDSGVARSLQLLSGQEHVDAEGLLEALGPVRGMLYFHLLLGRLRNLAAAGSIHA